MKIPTASNVCTRTVSAVAALLALAGTPTAAQVLHVDDRWEDCAIVLDPSLTQAAWHQFMGELGLVMHMRPLASARPLGARRFEVSVLSASTRIDDADDAWNDTFTHPHANHYLTDGNALPIPGLMARMGVTNRVDVGAYFTQNVKSNYGMVGGQVQYGLVDDMDRDLAAALRVSAVRLFGPEDLSVSVYGLEVVASSDVLSTDRWILSPYASLAGYLVRGQEHTAKVDLEDENVLGAQGTVGMALRISVLRLGVEYSVGKVDGYAFKVAIGS